MICDSGESLKSMKSILIVLLAAFLAVVLMCYILKDEISDEKVVWLDQIELTEKGFVQLGLSQDGLVCWRLCPEDVLKTAFGTNVEQDHDQ